MRVAIGPVRAALLLPLLISGVYTFVSNVLRLHQYLQIVKGDTPRLAANGGVVLPSEETKQRALEDVNAVMYQSRDVPPTDTTGNERTTTQLANKTSTKRPPLSSLVGDNKKHVIGDPQFLIDFAIIGFPKTGSTSMSSWIGLHPETQIHKDEMFSLSQGRPAGAVHHIYQKLLPNSNGTDYKRGYKSPYDITNMGGAMESIQRYWPKTRLLVGIRHPLHWLQSYINYRYMQKGGRPPSSRDMMNPRRKCVATLCSMTANFHVFLAGLQKTSASSLRGLDMNGTYAALGMQVPRDPTPNDIFLYDMEQLGDRNETRSAQFGRDIQAYLGLKELMPPIVHKNSGYVHHSGPTNNTYVNLCDAKYDDLKRELLKAARDASKWIRTYFLDAKGVYVSSRPYFEEIMQSWTVDPCATASG